MRIQILCVLLFIWALVACSPAEQPTRESTAESSVQILTDVLQMPELSRTRTLRIYLPPGYEDSQDRYPVLYMHDAQNLFDDKTSYAGEWGVDEALNELAIKQGVELIVVGIDNGGEKRMNELSPWPHDDFLPAEGKAYAQFIVNTVKPFIDGKYRTLSDRQNTAVMGSSMGGLLSHYLVYQHSDVFSKAGIFSPSYWFNPQVYTDTGQSLPTKDARLYFLIGEKEGPQMVSNMQRMVDQISSDEAAHAGLKSVVDPEGEHNEAFWRKHFKDSILWLYEVSEG